MNYSQSSFFSFPFFWGGSVLYFKFLNFCFVFFLFFSALNKLGNSKYEPNPVNESFVVSLTEENLLTHITLCDGKAASYMGLLYEGECLAVSSIVFTPYPSFVRIIYSVSDNFISFEMYWRFQKNCHFTIYKLD